MPAPSWLAATSGQPAQAGQINQFLATHQISYLYQGLTQAQQGIAGSGAVNTNGLSISQTFTTPAGDTTIGYVQLQLAVTGTPAPAAVSIQADVGGVPSGTPLVTTMVPREFLTGTASIQTIPLPATVTPSTTYHIVVSAVGDASNYYSWSKSNQTSGAQTSANGTTWAAAAYGFIYWVLDQTLVGPLTCMYEDAGARWTALTYGGVGGNQLTQLEEYTAGQTPTGYTASSRTLSYTATYPTKVT